MDDIKIISQLRSEIIIYFDNNADRGHIYEYDTDFDENRMYNVILAEMDMEDEPGSEATRITNNSLRRKIKAIVEEIINHYQTGYILDNNNKQLCVVIHDENLELTRENIEKITEEIQRVVMKVYSSPSFDFPAVKL